MARIQGSEHPSRHLSLAADYDDTDEEEEEYDPPPFTPVHLTFAGYLSGQSTTNEGWKLTVVVNHDQIPNAVPILQVPLGTVWKVTMERVQRDELPEPGEW